VLLSVCAAASESKFFARFFNFYRERAKRRSMPNYLELPVGPKSPELVNAVIEIPLEGINKYEYDKQLHVFRLDRNLYSPVHYPGTTGSFRARWRRMVTRWMCWCWWIRRAFLAAC
jgi:hypothetical protein